MLIEVSKIIDKITSLVDYNRSVEHPVKTVGKIMYELVGADGKVKQRGESHNLVVNEGDDYIVDKLATTPAQTAMDGMVLGTGWVSSSKTDTWVTTGFAGNGGDTANQGGIDSGYPQVKSGAGNENIWQWKATFEAGYATQTGIDEVVIANSNPDGSGNETAGEILAHGQISPAVNKGASDSLVVTWEITFTGS